MNRLSGQKLACIWSPSEPTTRESLLSLTFKSQMSDGAFAASAGSSPSEDQSVGNQVRSQNQRRPRGVLEQERLIAATGARALLIKLGQTVSIAPKAKTLTAWRPHRPRN